MSTNNNELKAMEENLQSGYRLLGPDFVSRLEKDDNMKYLPAVMKVIQNAGFSLPEKERCIELSKQKQEWETVGVNPYLEIEDLLYYIQTPCDGYREFISFLSSCYSKNVLYHFFLVPNRYHALCRAQDLYKAPENDEKYNEVLRLYKIQLCKDMRNQIVDPSYADCYDFEELPIETLCKEIEDSLVDDNYNSIVAKDIIKKIQSDDNVWGPLFKQVRYLVWNKILG